MTVTDYMPGRFIIFDAIVAATKRAGWKNPRIEVFQSPKRTECCITHKSLAFVFHQNKDGYELIFSGTWTKNHVHFLKRVETRRGIQQTKYRRPKVRKFVAHSLAAEKKKDNHYTCQEVVES